ncbi:hypothetical protein R6Q59_025067, partial [Mikania micrantha]
SFDRKSSKFHYDPIGYALNFDEGPLEKGDLVRNFSSRYASRTKTPIISKTLIDLGKDAIGPNFV